LDTNVVIHLKHAGKDITVLVVVTPSLKNFVLDKGDTLKEEDDATTPNLRDVALQ